MASISTRFPATPRNPTADPPLSAQLDREWARLRRRPVALATANGWRIVSGPITDLDQILVAIGYRDRTGGPVERERQNDALRALVKHARTDDLAARVVLQRMVPGMLADLSRRGDGDRRDRTRFEELVGSAWISIRLAHVADDTRFMAARLMDDAWYRAFRGPRRRRDATELSVDPNAFSELPVALDPTPLDELADILGEARRRGLAHEDVTLIRALLRVESPARLAAERKVTPRTVRNHRDRAIHSIRRLAATPAA